MRDAQGETSECSKQTEDKVSRCGIDGGLPHGRTGLPHGQEVVEKSIQTLVESIHR